MSYNIKNYREQGGESWVVDGKLTVNGTLEVDAGATVTGLVDVSLLVPASASALGGIKAATKGAGDTVECKIDATSSKLYVAPPAAATADAAGVVKMAANVPELDDSGEPLEVDDVVETVNLLLRKLKEAGIMVDDET
jgi:hypothetical protein